MQVCSVFYLATNTKVHSEVSFIIILFSVFYASLFFVACFVVTFESSYSRSYFNLFLIYAVTCNTRKYKPSQNINSSKLIVQKISLVQKYRDNFPNLQIKTFHWSFFSLKNLTRKCSCFHCTCEWSLLCFSRNKSFLEILLSGEYKKSWFLETQDSVFAF